MSMILTGESAPLLNKNSMTAEEKYLSLYATLKRKYILQNNQKNKDRSDGKFQYNKL